MFEVQGSAGAERQVMAALLVVRDFTMNVIKDVT